MICISLIRIQESFYSMLKRYKNIIITFFLVITFCISICFVPINATHLIPMVEEQAKQEYGLEVHVEKLIFRFGPALKIKAPVMHVMYPDGQKFGQLDNVKFYVPWSTLFKNNIYVNKIYADKFILKTSSNDKYLKDLINSMQSKEFDMYPNLIFKNYNISYTLYDKNKHYQLKGKNLELSKLLRYKNLKLNTDGEFIINDTPYISYNLSLTPNLDLPKNKNIEFDFFDFLNQIETLDFHSDIIADIKLYNDKNENLQISGLVNIDNISVLDPKNTTPKSFIYLTFWGNKTGILSNIYTSNNKKIYTEGVINNSKKPEIELKVKTDKIRIADIYQKLKLIASCSRFKDIDAIDGEIVADFNLKGDLKKIKSSGYLKINDAYIKSKGININKITSDVDFSNNFINISNATGYVNNAPILLKGSINHDINLQLLMNKIDLKELLPENYGVKSGLISIDANISGKLDNIIHKENLIIEKFKMLNSGNVISFDKLNINTNKDNAAYISNIILKPAKTEFIKLPQVKILINNDSLKINDTNIFMPNSKMKFSANVTNYNTSDLTFNSELSGIINSKDLSGYTKTSVVYPAKVNIYGNKNVQNLDAQIQLINASIMDEPALINLNAQKSDNTLKIADLSLSPFTGTLASLQKSNNKFNKKIIITGIIENLKNPSFKNFRIFIPQQLNLNIQDVVAQIKGDLFINGNVIKPEIIGQLSISSLINQYMQLSLSNAVIDFNKNIAVFNAPIIKILDSSFGINGNVSMDLSKNLLIKNLNIKSKFLNMDTFLMYKDKLMSNDIPITIEDGKIYSERIASSLYDSNLYVSALNAEFSMMNKILKIKNITSDMYNGKLAGNIEYDLKNDTYKTAMQGRGVSSYPIFTVVSPKNESISGTMDFDMNIAGSLLSKQSLNGNVKFIIKNGHMGTLGKLEHLLYAQNVIADNMLRTSLGLITKAITLKDTGLFKYLKGDIALKDGVANINMMQSQGPLMSLYFKGQYNILNQNAKLVILGRLSDEITSSLGAFGEFSINKLMLMLTGEENPSNSIIVEDIEKLPQLPTRNTKEFRSIINGNIEKPSSVILFNWISYTHKSLRQKDINTSKEKVPDFIEALPY